ncbi:hypothetical protein Pelo_3463 [Pelomyxa schiedti]|nr:hypothetical protein Pelo_3463 [Pelomyxa schiedti]
MHPRTAASLVSAPQLGQECIVGASAENELGQGGPEFTRGNYGWLGRIQARMVSELDRVRNFDNSLHRNEDTLEQKIVRIASVVGTEHLITMDSTLLSFGLNVNSGDDEGSKGSFTKSVADFEVHLRNKIQEALERINGKMTPTLTTKPVPSAELRQPQSDSPAYISFTEQLQEKTSRDAADQIKAIDAIQKANQEARKKESRSQLQIIDISHRLQLERILLEQNQKNVSEKMRRSMQQQSQENRTAEESRFAVMLEKRRQDLIGAILQDSATRKRIDWEKQLKREEEERKLKEEVELHKKQEEEKRQKAEAEKLQLLSEQEEMEIKRKHQLLLQQQEALMHREKDEESPCQELQSYETQSNQCLTSVPSLQHSSAATADNHINTNLESKEHPFVSSDAPESTWPMFLHGVGLESYLPLFSSVRSTPLQVSEYDVQDLRELLKYKVGIQDVEDRNVISVALRDLKRAPTGRSVKVPCPNSPVVKNISPSPGNTEQNAAATKIQACWRGYRVRSLLKKMNIQIKKIHFPEDEVPDLSWCEMPSDLNDAFPLSPGMEEEYHTLAIPPPPDISLPFPKNTFRSSTTFHFLPTPSKAATGRTSMENILPKHKNLTKNPQWRKSTISSLESHKHKLGHPPSLSTQSHSNTTLSLPSMSLMSRHCPSTHTMPRHSVRLPSQSQSSTPYHQQPSISVIPQKPTTKVTDENNLNEASPQALQEIADEWGFDSIRTAELARKMWQRYESLQKKKESPSPRQFPSIDTSHSSLVTHHSSPRTLSTARNPEGSTIQKPRSITPLPLPRIHTCPLPLHSPNGGFHTTSPTSLHVNSAGPRRSTAPSTTTTRTSLYTPHRSSIVSSYSAPPSRH